MKCIVLSKEGCVYCDKAVELLVTKNISYTKEIVDKETLKKSTGKHSWPQIFIDDIYIGGFFELEEFLNEKDPILEPNSNRFTIFPIRYANLWSLYKKAQMSNWTAEEIDFSKDMADWNSLSSDEKHFIKSILAFFASSDGIVFENISINFSTEVQLSEARSFYAYQQHNEMVHG